MPQSNPDLRNAAEVEDLTGGVKVEVSRPTDAWSGSERKENLLTSDELAQIAEHADQIREGAAQRSQEKNAHAAAEVLGLPDESYEDILKAEQARKDKAKEQDKPDKGPERTIAGDLDDGIIDDEPSENPESPEDEPEPIEIKELAELDKELNEKLKEATDRYAFLTAKDRQAFLGRFMKKETGLGKLIGKIPGVKGAAERLNERQGKEIESAIAEYKQLVAAAVQEVTAYYESNGIASEALDMIERTELLAHSASLEASIITKREELAEAAGGAGWFTNQWVNGGKLKKAGIVLAAGAAAGVVVATGGAALGVGSIFGMSTGALAGGIAGGKVAHSITRRRAGAVYNEKNKAGGQAGETVAEHQSYLDQKEYGANIENDSDASAETIVSGVEKSSDEEMYRNRKRVRTARALGAAAGGAAGFGARAAFEGMFGGSKNATAEAVSPESKPPKDIIEAPKPNVDNAGEVTQSTKEALKGTDFNVEQGNASSHEWMDWAGANGKNLNAEDAYSVHEIVGVKFGANGIKDNVVTYFEKVDLELPSLGQTAWKPEVAEFAQKWMQARGKW